MNLNQITVPVSKIDRSIVFYGKLGLKVIVHSPEYVRFECPDGDATFSLHQVDQLPIGDGIWVYFEVKDLDSYVDALIAKGITIDEMPNDKSWLWREARLRDPDRNQIILYYAGVNRKNPPWRV